MPSLPRPQFLLTALLLSLFAHAPAKAAEYKVYRDDGGLPRCLVAKDKRGFRREIYFSWNEAHRYQKTLTAFDLENTFVNQADDRTGWFSGHLFRCSSWKDYRRAKLSGDSTEATGASDTLFGVPIPPELRQAFEQIRSGATTYHASDVPADFLSELQNPAEITLEDVRTLTRKYGAPFAAEVYRAWIHAQPGNRDLELDLFWRIRRGETRIQSLPADVKILVVAGFSGGITEEGMQVPNWPMDPMVDPQLITMGHVLRELQEMGFDAEGVVTPPYARIEHTTPIVQSALERALSEGRRVVFFSMSRGVAETLSAIANVRSMAEAEGRLPELEGRIAVLNLSGLLKGSLVGDFVRSNPLIRWFGFLIERLTGRSHSTNAILGGGDLTVERVSKLYQLNLTHLPRDLVIWNLVGIVPKLTPRFRDLRAKWDDYVTWLQPSRGAQDGMIEYPLTEAMRSDFPRARTLVFDSTHALVDGEFMTYDLTDPAQRKRVLKTIVLEFTASAF